MREKKMKENVDLKEVVHIAIKTATLCQLAVYTKREFMNGGAIDFQLWGNGEF
jgi:hypothetical protein